MSEKTIQYRDRNGRRMEYIKDFRSEDHFDNYVNYKLKKGIKVTEVYPS